LSHNEDGIMLDVLALAQQCAPTVSPPTMAAILHVESNLNPYAIGVVNGRLVRQPQTMDEAIATAKALEAADWNFSVGIAQINRHNLAQYTLTYEQAFEPCANVRVAAKILEDCFARAKRGTSDEQTALRAALSCYYSGNFTRGFQPDKAGQPSYVQKVLTQAATQAIPVVPALISGTPNHKAAALGTTTQQDAPVLLKPSVDGSAVRLHPASPKHSPQQEQPAVAHEPAKDTDNPQRPVIVF